MEAEFVNAYITKLRSTIDELTHRNIMLDTELLVTKNLCQSLQQQIDSLRSDLESIQAEKATVKQPTKLKKDDSGF